MVELVVSLSAHKLKYVVVTHSHSSERFVQAYLKYMNVQIDLSKKESGLQRIAIEQNRVNFHHFLNIKRQFLIDYLIFSKSLFIIDTNDTQSCQSYFRLHYDYVL